jgi:hypothetical protein
MDSRRYALVRGRALRATKLNGCGSPVLGPDSVVTTDGFISVGLTPNTEEGTAISVTNAAGNVCVLDSPTPKFTSWAIVVTFCGVDPALFNLLTGQPVVMNAAGDEVVGFGVDSDIDVDATGFALELWSNVPVAVCDESGEATYGYLLIPFSKGGTIGDLSVENGALNFSVTGAVSRDGNDWGVGPYDVVRDEAGVAGPLNEAISVNRHLHQEITTVPPPSVSTEGSTALGVPATGATAGIPATLTPANSYAPANLADASTLTATPTTAWTAGQYVLLRDGSKAHWTSSAWAAGVA